MTARQIMDQVTDWGGRIVGLGLLGLIASTVAARYGLRAPLPVMAPQELAWLAAAWLAWRWR